MTEHSLKIYPVFYDAVANGAKTFEIRKNDRDYQVGDTLCMREFTGRGSDGVDNYTGRVVYAKVTYVLTSEDFPRAIVDGYAVLGIEVLRDLMLSAKVRVI